MRRSRVRRSRARSLRDGHHGLWVCEDGRRNPAVFFHLGVRREAKGTRWGKGNAGWGHPAYKEIKGVGALARIYVDWGGDAAPPYQENGGGAPPPYRVFRVTAGGW